MVTPEPAPESAASQASAGSKRSAATSDERAARRTSRKLRRLALAKGLLSEEDPPGTPLVTVVIPNWNDARFVGDAIRSVKQQSFKHFQCVVVDDASTDDSVAAIAKAIGRDQRFSLVRHAENLGLSAGRNTGLRLADTPFVCFLDSDDLFARENLAERLRLMLQRLGDPMLAGVYSGVVQRTEDVLLNEVDPTAPWNGPKMQDLLTTRGECPFNCHAPLLRTEILREFGGFDESMRHGAEDWELWLRIMRNGWMFRSTGTVLAVYRQKAQSMVRTMPEQHLGEARRLLASVHEPVAPDHVVLSAPFLLDEPLGHYERAVQMGRRVLQYAGMAALTDSVQGLDKALDHLDASLLPLLRRHIDVGRTVESGLRRGLGADAELWRTTSDLAEADLLRIMNAIDLREREATRRLPPAVLEQLDVLFAPENARAAAQMMLAADALPEGITWAFLRADQVVAAAGVGEVVESVRQISFNRWMLGGAAPRVLAVQWPFSPTVSAAIERVRGESLSVELIDEEHPIARLDEAEAANADLRVGLAGFTSAVVGSEDRQATVPTYVADVGSAAVSMFEENPVLAPEQAEMANFKDRHRGERCVIIGNGPSLNNLDLTLLRDECTIGVNGIFHAATIDFPLSFYVVEDSSVMKENIEAIRDYTAGHKFFPTIYRDLYGETGEENVTWFTMNRGFYAPESPNYCIPRFSTDLRHRAFCGQSVTIINLQLAYWMGFSDVYLIGMDFSYTIPDTAERDGDLITSTEDDPNHFHPDYFGKGKTWKDPKLERVLNNYEMAKAMFAADGRTIWNATAGGKLELFPRADFAEVFGSA